MTLRIITDATGGIWQSLLPSSKVLEFAHTVRNIGTASPFHSIANRGDDRQTNSKLLRNAQMAQVSISELMAIRREAGELRALFATLDTQSPSFNATVAQIRNRLANPPTQKVVNLFKPDETALFTQAWGELGLMNLAELADPAERTGQVAKALSILNTLDAKLACMLKHYEKILLDTVITRENIAAQYAMAAYVGEAQAQLGEAVAHRARRAQ
jgi:hypothetical protein